MLTQEKRSKKGYRHYELSNHLGNVLAVITDRRIQACGAGDVMYYEAQIVSISDYYPFGMTIKERSYQAVSYRFGFNGYERDDEVKGRGNSIDFGARIYDPRLGRFLSTDPWQYKYAWQTPYAYFKNCPTSVKDFAGLGGGDDGNKDLNSTTKQHTVGKGESLYALAKKHSTTVAGLKKINPQIDWTSAKRTGDKQDWIYEKEVINVPNENSSIVDKAVTHSEGTLPFNSGDYEVRPSDLPLVVVGAPSMGSEGNWHRFGIYEEFSKGIGPTNSVLLEDHAATQTLQFSSNEVNKLRAAIFEKFDGSTAALMAEAENRNGMIYSEYKAYSGSFKPWDEGSNEMQFIGTFSADVIYDKASNQLVFIITDSKGLKSLLYRASDNKERDPSNRTPYGNTTQKYIWNEDLDLMSWYQMYQYYDAKKNPTKYQSR